MMHTIASNVFVRRFGYWSRLPVLVRLYRRPMGIWVPVDHTLTDEQASELAFHLLSERDQWSRSKEENNADS